MTNQSNVGESRKKYFVYIGTCSDGTRAVVVTDTQNRSLRDNRFVLKKVGKNQIDFYPGPGYSDKLTMRADPVTVTDIREIDEKTMVDINRGFNEYMNKRRSVEERYKRLELMLRARKVAEEARLGNYWHLVDYIKEEYIGRPKDQIEGGTVGGPSIQ